MAVKVVQSDDLHTITTCAEWRQLCVAIDAFFTKFERCQGLDIDQGTRAILFAMQVVPIAHRCENCYELAYPYSHGGNGEWLYYCECGEAFSSWQTTEDCNRIGKF